MNRTRPSPITCFLLALAAPLLLRADARISIQIGPPPIPNYDQPMSPRDGMAWTPGYWAWGDAGGYVWVPGAWVATPGTGMLWTPGYWGWSGEGYMFHAGHWGTQVGFYGGVNYGHGYGGSGFQGGSWRGTDYYYNTAVTTVDPSRTRHVYSKPATGASTSRVAFSGGVGGLPGQAPAEPAKTARHAPAPDARLHPQAKLPAPRGRVSGPVRVSTGAGHPEPPQVNPPAKPQRLNPPPAPPRRHDMPSPRHADPPRSQPPGQTRLPEPPRPQRPEAPRPTHPSAPNPAPKPAAPPQEHPH